MRALFVLLMLSAGRVAQAPDAATPSALSAIHSAAQTPAPAACVKLIRSEPFPPDESPLPKYPEDAKAAHVEGDVSFHFEVGSGCAPEEVTIDDGPQLLREAVQNAVKDWKYCGVP